MSYSIEWSRKATKSLAQIATDQQKRIRTAVDKLAEDPRPVGYENLKGAPGFRIRIGDYRVVYVIDDAVNVVEITNVGPRGNVYRNV